MKREPLEEVADSLLDPEPREFFEELWVRAEAEARRRAMRWRAIAVGVAVVAIATVAATAVVAASRNSGVVGGSRVIDKTVACGARTQGLSGLQIMATVNEPPTNGKPNWGLVGIDSGSTPPQIFFAGASRLLFLWTGSKYRTVTQGFAFDNTVCEPAAQIPLSSAGLPPKGVYTRRGNGDFSANCPSASGNVVVIRLHVTLAKPGLPSAAEMAVAVGRKRHPVSFVDWTPTRFKAFLSNGCLTP